MHIKVICFFLLLACFTAFGDHNSVTDDTTNDVDKNSIEQTSAPKKMPFFALSKVLKNAGGSLKFPSKATTELIGRVLTRTLSSFQFPGELSLSSNALQLVAVAGAVVLGLLGMAVIAALMLPLFGVRICQLAGTCADHFSYGQLIGAPAHAYEAYSAPATFNQPTAGASYIGAGGDYQKRSMDYFAPILETLSAAYEKYDKMSAKGKQ